MFNLSFEHTNEDQFYISAWMQEATNRNLPNEGLRHNYKDFCDGSFGKWSLCPYPTKIACFRHKGKAEAFMLYHTTNYSVVCHVIYVNPAFQHQGVGKRFQTAINEYYRKCGCVISVIEDPSEKGLRLIRHLNYKLGYEKAKLWYKPLIVTRRQHWKANCRLVLHTDAKTGKIPLKSWAINTQKCKKPVIEPAEADMILEIMVGQKSVYEEKVKYFYEDYAVFKDGYLYITNSMLKEITQKYIHNKEH